MTTAISRITSMRPLLASTVRSATPTIATYATWPPAPLTAHYATGLIARRQRGRRFVQLATGKLKTCSCTASQIILKTA